MKKSILISVLILFGILFFNKVHSQWNQFNTPYGHIKLGPADANYAHIYSNISRFLFNGDINVQSNFGFSSYYNSPLLLKTEGVTQMTILNGSGNVGIGVSNPTEKLEVEGKSIFNDQITINHPLTTAWNYAIKVNVNHDNTRAFVVKSASGETMFNVYGNGNVNVKKLCAEEIEVRLNAMLISWPDYVFASDYEMLSVYELNKYIEINKHLPDVPSEKEVEEDGINVAEMNAILLRKIEELTLYMIEQQKEIDALKSSLNQ